MDSDFCTPPLFCSLSRSRFLRLFCTRFGTSREGKAVERAGRWPEQRNEVCLKVPAAASSAVPGLTYLRASNAANVQWCALNSISLVSSWLSRAILAMIGAAVSCCVLLSDEITFFESMRQ